MPDEHSDMSPLLHWRGDERVRNRAAYARPGRAPGARQPAIGSGLASASLEEQRRCHHCSLPCDSTVAPASAAVDRALPLPPARSSPATRSPSSAIRETERSLPVARPVLAFVRSHSLEPAGRWRSQAREMRAQRGCERARVASCAVINARSSSAVMPSTRMTLSREVCPRARSRAPRALSCPQRKTLRRRCMRRAPTPAHDAVAGDSAAL
jgi:hypothetical protein